MKCTQIKKVNTTNKAKDTTTEHVVTLEEDGLKIVLKDKKGLTARDFIIGEDYDIVFSTPQQRLSP